MNWYRKQLLLSASKSFEKEREISTCRGQIDVVDYRSDCSHEHSWPSGRKVQDEIVSLSNELALTPHRKSKALS